MDGKEAIIKRIISDAEKKSKALIGSAEADAEERKKDANDWAEEYLKTQRELLKTETEEIVKRRLTVAELDVRKISLKARQDLIAAVYDSAYEKLCKIDKKDYLKLVEKLIVENAEEGDTVVLSCDKVLKPSDIEKLEVFSEKGLKVQPTGDFIGGIMLVGKNCDKNLTFKAVIEDMKDNLSFDLLNCLFGE